jgi:polyhydroxyalkanoate synthase
MIPPLLSGDPRILAEEMVEYGRKTLAGIQALSRLDSDAIEVGFSPKVEVWSREGVTLYRYEPRRQSANPIPVLICYALVNRPYMVDLEEGRSLVSSLLDLGLDVYLIDWGYPGRIDRWRSLDDYINGLLDDCVDAVRTDSGQPAVNLLGICQGGTFSLCYAALHAEKVKNLIVMVTPVDFHPGDASGASCGMLNNWARHMDVDLMVEALGNVPGDFMNFGFVLMKPFQLNVAKYASIVDIAEDPDRLANFLRMEKWIFDSPDQAGETWRQFLKDFYQENKLVSGRLELGGRKVDLSTLAMPVLNIYAAQDHLVPPESSKALANAVGTEDYAELSFDTGHIGMYVSGKVQKALPGAIAEWLDERR